MDRDLIARGRRELDLGLALHGAGPYLLQAAIASLHVEEPRPWGQIAALYEQLVRVTRSPVVELSWAIAVAEVEGPEAALAIVERLELEGYHYLHATRGDLLSRIGRAADAAEAYGRALELAHDDAERRLIDSRVRELGERSGGQPAT